MSIGGHGRWRLKILAIASIYWGSPLEFIWGVVLMLNVNIYINFRSLGGGDHYSPWEPMQSGDWKYYLVKEFIGVVHWSPSEV